jgi:hypothetical protein
MTGTAIAPDSPHRHMSYMPILLQVRITDHAEHSFRSKANTHSGLNANTDFGVMPNTFWVIPKQVFGMTPK